MNMLTEMAVRMMMVDNKLWDNKRQNIDWNINNFEYLLLKTFELYCVTVWRSGGNACIDVGVESDGCRSVLKGKKLEINSIRFQWIYIEFAELATIDNLCASCCANEPSRQLSNIDV